MKFEKRIWPPIPYSTDNPTEKPVVPIKPLTVQNSGTNIGSREEEEESGFFVISQLWMRGYFRLG